MAVKAPKRRRFTPEELKQWTEVVDIRTLRPHPRNPHIGDTDKIGRSLGLHGQFRTVVISKDGYVLMGNHTYAAAMEREQTKMGVIRLPLKHDDPQAVEVMLADNQPAKDALEDQGILQLLLEDIEKAQGSIEGTLWEDDFLRQLQRQEKKEGKSDPDETPGKPKHPFTKLGDLWQLGDHRLICGDSTSQQLASSLMGKRTADMIFTDPPYNTDYRPIATKKRPGRKEWADTGISGDNQGKVAFRIFLEASFTAANRYLHPGGSIYVCTDWPAYPEMLMAFKRFWHQWSMLVWDKGHIGLGSTTYRPQFELLIFGSKGDKRAHWNAGQRERDVWKIEREKVKSYQHPTQKPVELVERAMNNSSNRGHLILDPFGGSGTTLLAAERTGRVCYMVEIDPGWVDVICRRWQEFTGDLPKLKGKAHDFTR